MAKEGVSLTKYLALCNFESRHNVDLGMAYKSDISAKSFVIIVFY